MSPAATELPDEPVRDHIDPAAATAYERALTVLRDANVPFLVGGTQAFTRYTGIERPTKDMDLFLRPRHLQHALDVLEIAGFRTEIPYPHWLAKAHLDGHFVDLIFSSGNGVAEVDDIWFEYAVDSELLGHPVKLCPVEETIWSKAYLMERERYDGADVVHLMHGQRDRMSWERLVWRFGGDWRVLLAHLVLFGYIYPDARGNIPERVLRDLLRRLEEETGESPGEGRVCWGTLLSREQYLHDLRKHGYVDARQLPRSGMSAEEIERWTPSGEAPREGGDD